MSGDLGGYEYVVMHPGYPEHPHRRPFRRGEDGGDYFDLTPRQQREWCNTWVADCERDGMRPGSFYVAWRIVTPWRRIDAETAPEATA